MHARLLVLIYIGGVDRLPAEPYFLWMEESTPKLPTKAEARKEGREAALALVARVANVEKSKILKKAMETYGTKSLTLEQQMRACTEKLLIMTRFPEFELRLAEEALDKPFELLKIIAMLGPKKLEVEVDYKPVIFLPAGMTSEEWLARMAARKVNPIEVEALDVQEEKDDSGRGGMEADPEAGGPDPLPV